MTREVTQEESILIQPLSNCSPQKVFSKVYAVSESFELISKV